MKRIIYMGPTKNDFH